MITWINEAKALVKHVSAIGNPNSILQHVIQIKNGLMKHANATVKSINRTKNITVWILVHVFVKLVNT